MEVRIGPAEKSVLSLLGGEKTLSVGEIARRTGLDQAAVMRAALGLREKGLVEISEERRKRAVLTEEGARYARAGLPERRLLKALVEGELPVERAGEITGLDRQEVNIALTWCRKRGWVEFAERDGVRIIRATREGLSAAGGKTEDERLLEAIARGEEVGRDEVLRTLERRGLVEVTEVVERRLSILPEGERLLRLGVEAEEEISELTKEVIVTGRWRTGKLKRYDVLAPVPAVHPAKPHPQQMVIDEVRRILLEMGFVEIKARIVESEFWNFDALFQPQDHPARDIHDSLWTRNPERTALPDERLVARVARSHERGVAGSRGWGYRFNPEVSRRPVLCSQTTAATVRYLASRPEPPVKVFCINRVYRHEKIDYKHLAEFYQCEGIVMNKGLTLRDMLGYLKQILVRLGFEKIRFRPGYFPFTEPSVEADVYQGDRGEWLEILGAGMFRPEVLRPLGIRHPVLAWGIGLSRLMMLRLELEDIRDLFKNDLEWLRASRGV